MPHVYNCMVVSLPLHANTHHTSMASLDLALSRNSCRIRTERRSKNAVPSGDSFSWDRQCIINATDTYTDRQTDRQDGNNVPGPGGLPRVSRQTPRHGGP